MLGEYEGFVRIAESLGEHHHHHRYFEASTVDTKLRLCIIPGVEIREEDAVERLIHNTCYTEHQKRERITEHLAQNRNVKSSSARKRERQQTKRLDGGSQDITEEDIEHIILTQHNEEEDVKRNIQQHKQ